MIYYFENKNMNIIYLTHEIQIDTFILITMLRANYFFNI